jgi:acetyltransferase-like isoleucine patch superfamily enzyme
MKMIQDRLAGYRDPEAFARSLGVRLNGKVTFYGMNRGMFGSEPWLISLGDNVFITSGVQFVTHDGGTLILRKEIPDLEWTAPISVGNDVYLGLRALILPGVTIGNRCIIAAASVVTRDVPDNSVVGGVPARRISSVDEYMEKMKAKSLGLGHLSGAEKAIQLKKHFGIDQ